MQDFLNVLNHTWKFQFLLFYFKSLLQLNITFFTNVFDSHPLLLAYLVNMLRCNCVFADVSPAWRWPCRSALKDPCGRSWWWGTKEESLWLVTSRPHSSTRGWPILLLRTWWGKLNVIVECKCNPQKVGSCAKIFV